MDLLAGIDMGIEQVNCLDVECVTDAAAEAANPDSALAAVGDVAPPNSVCGVSLAKPSIHGRQQPRKGVPNYSPEEVVAAVWAFISISEVEVHQSMAIQLKRITQIYLLKALELKRLGRWNTSIRTPEQSAKFRCGNSQGLYARARKALKIIWSSITPVWQQVNSENHSGWGVPELVKETKNRRANDISMSLEY